MQKLNRAIAMTVPRPHAVILSSPGMGHRVPVLQLSQRLITNHGFRVTIFVVTTETSSVESRLFRFHADTPFLHVIQLPSVYDSGHVPIGATVGDKLGVMMREACPMLRSSIASMPYKPTVLLVDIFGIGAMDIAIDFGIPKYVFLTTAPWFLVLTACIPILDMEIEGEYVYQKEPLPLPGCKPIRPHDVVDAMLNRTAGTYGKYVQVGAEMRKADGFLLNTWEDLEKPTLGAIRENQILRRLIRGPVYPIGPLVEHDDTGGEVLQWLDSQPTESVVYVSFGSGGTLSRKQMEEIAWGLERSGQRFIWVFRPPVESESDGAFFTPGDEGEGPAPYLPEGFLTRKSGVGLVVFKCAPQAEILRHP